MRSYSVNPNHVESEGSIAADVAFIALIGLTFVALLALFV